MSLTVSTSMLELKRIPKEVNVDVLEGILYRLYQADLIDICYYRNQYTKIAYCGNGIIIPSDWVIKVMSSGQLICSNAEFFEYLLSYYSKETLPPSKNIFKNIERTLNKEKEILPKLPEFPNEESKWVWLAGIIDAECSLSLQKSNKKGRSRRGFQYIPRLNCSSTTPILLFQMQKVCHPYGSVSSHNKQDKRSSFWKSTRKFGVYGNGLRKILPLVLSYLVIKRRQAEILLEALSLLSRGLKSNSVEIRLQELWFEIRKLNKRGK